MNTLIFQSASCSATRTTPLLRCINSDPCHSHFHVLKVKAVKTVYYTKFVMAKPRVAPQTSDHSETGTTCSSLHMPSTSGTKVSAKTQLCRSQRSHTGPTAQLCHIGNKTLTNDRKRITPAD